MKVIYNGDLKSNARTLRKGMTEAEIKLWYAIRMNQLEGFQFYRQRIMGNYIVDFYCPGAKLVIEVDGSQHYESQQIEEDKKRDRYLNIRGFKVLRFNDNEVLTNIEGVLESILENIRDQVKKSL